ncbi:MAG: nucleotidyltransferase [Bacteroidota bacterium]
MSSTANNRFPEHFRTFIQCLNKHKVEYLIIGGYAMGAYGHHRGTGDLDIFVSISDINAERLVKASIEYGIPSDSVKKDMFIVPKMIGIGNPPLRIEILKHLDNIDFKYAFQRMEKREVEGLQINLISLDDLILLKRSAKKDRSAARDAEDLSFLEKLKIRLQKGKS